MFNRIRNIRKRWIIVSATVALLAIGLVSGAAFAADARAGHFAGALHDADGTSRGHGRHGLGDSSAVMTRVAEILGIEQATLDSAFATAKDEQAETKFDAKIEGLIDDETLTQDQGDAATGWFEERPSLSGPVAIRLASTDDSDKVDNFLAKLVENEKLTQDESDALSEWHDDRPDSLPVVEHSHRRHRGHNHDGDSNDDGENS